MTRKRLSVALLAVAFVAGAAYAINWTIDELRYRALLADRALVAGDRDVSVKPQRDCPDPEASLVFVIFGQSNAANHGAARLSAPEGVFDFYDGRCFTGDDPQFLATGKGGSPWPAFAEAMRARGIEQPILIANVAVGNTRLDQWIPGAEHANSLRQTTGALHKRAYAVDAFLFFQGEADRETSYEEYKTNLGKLTAFVDNLAADAPLLVSDTSLCGVETMPATQLSRARSDKAAEADNLFLGPDTDALGFEYRSDGCHFNEAGQRTLGALWAESVWPLIR